MDLSIVIPVYNEAQKIAHDISAASGFLSRCGMTGEIIVSDDGSTDRTSEVALNTKVDEGVSLRITGYGEHAGKGRAVKTGIMEAGSGIVLFIDSGNCVPFEQISRGIDLLKSGQCDIAHGSRFLDESLITRPRKPCRKLVSFLFRKFIRRLSRVPGHLTDTQCGLKIYPKKIAHELYADCITDGFLFDIEIILRAREKGYRILEFPIEWTSDPDSRLSVRATFPEIFSELRMIRKVLRPSGQQS
jgi:glycosyltransferase involved in cell wall biosynthesis